MPKTVKAKPKAAKPVTNPAAIARELPPGVLGIIELVTPITLHNMEVSELKIRRGIGIRELTAIQLAYRKQGTPISGTEVISVIASVELLATSTLIDEMCQLPKGTAEGELAVDMRNYWAAVEKIIPFVTMLP